MKSEIGKTLLTVVLLVIAFLGVFFGLSYVMTTSTRVDFLGIEVRRMDGLFAYGPFAYTRYQFDFSTGNEEMSQSRFPGTLLYVHRDEEGYFLFRYTRLYRVNDVDFEKAARIFEETKIRFRPIVEKKMIEFERQKKGKLLYYE